MGRPPPNDPTRPRAPNARSAFLEDITEDSPPEPVAPSGPQLIDGRYRIEALIGRGGMGAVHRATQLNVGREVALKTLTATPDDEDYASLVERFEAEARIVSQLRHSNAVRLFDFGHLPDGRLYIASELLQGRTLDQVIQEGPLPPMKVAEIMLEIADALAEAHDKQIIHRDVKPKNIFLDRVGDRELVRVLDFGIAKYAGARTQTAVGVVIGSPAYVSPEQARGEELTPKSDLYSLGVLAFECLTGELPFKAVNAASLLLKHANDPPPPLDPQIPPPLRALVNALLAKSPAARPKDAREVRDRLRVMLEPQPPAPRPSSQRPFVVLAIGLVLIAIFLYVVLRPQP